MQASPLPGDQLYQRAVLTALLKWTLTVGPLATLLNLLGFLIDPFWTTLVGSAGVLVLVLIAWHCLRLAQDGQVQRAARIYIVSGLVVMTLVVFIGARNEALLGAMGMCVFVVMATFFEPPSTALSWGLLSSLLYEIGFFARSFDPSRDLGLRVDVFSLYIVPPIILLFLAMAGRIMNEHLTQALAASQTASLDLIRSYAEVEQRVSERTHDLVKERYRLNAALAELTAARDQAETASRAKSAFLANMSHELRTPLTTILGYTALIEQDLATIDAPGIASDLSRISLAGNHLLELISDVLDLAEVEAGTMILHPAPFAITALVDEVVERVRPLAAQQHNQLIVSYDSAPEQVALDHMRVKQLLLNLLSNAAKFTNCGTITLQISAERPAQSALETPGWIIFRVSDTGIGIAAHQLPQVFQPFTQGDAARAHPLGGTGLGLAICRRYCQLMGGEITVSSEEGQGSVFTVRLPAMIAAPAGATQLTSALP